MVIDVSVFGSSRHEKPSDDDEEFLHEDLLLDAESGAGVELPLIEVVGLLQLVEFFCLPTFLPNRLCTGHEAAASRSRVVPARVPSARARA